MWQEFRLQEVNIPPFDINKSLNSIDSNLSKYVIPGCIVIIPFTVVGASGELYIGHLYCIGQWGVMFVTFPKLRSRQQYVDVLNTAGPIVKELGAIFLDGKNPGLDFKQLIRVTDLTQHRAIKDYSLNYLSYLRGCHTIEVARAEISEVNSEGIDLSCVSHWTIDTSKIKPSELADHLDYKLAVENIQPHKDLLADELLTKIIEDPTKGNRYKVAFEESIRAFKRQDNLLYEKTEAFLFNHKTRFSGISKKVSKEFTPFRVDFNTVNKNKSKAGQQRVEGTLELPKQVETVAPNVYEWFLELMLAGAKICWARFKDKLSRWWLSFKENFGNY